MRQPAWYRDFLDWLAEPCPSDEWVYRGQAARYGTVLPGMLRPGNGVFYDSRRLFFMDPGLAERIVSTSPVFGKGHLHHQIGSDGPAGRALDHDVLANAMLGRSEPGAPEVGFTELLQALAQHYDFPTLFVDVSFSGHVSAFFATYALRGGTYDVSAEPGVVYRWPARRTDPFRFRIEGVHEGRDATVGVIDIRRVHPLVRRPRHQRGGLATPVSDLKPPYQPFASSLNHLDWVDMASMSGCERFELPAGAGAVLTEMEGKRMDGLFPDGIDLGFAYVSIVALLSLVIHEPGEGHAPTVVQSLHDHYERAVLAARTLLDRECLRLVPGCPVTSLVHRQTLGEIRVALQQAISAATEATTKFGEPRFRWKAGKRFQKEEEKQRAEAQRRLEAWLETATDVPSEEVAEMRLRGAPKYSVRRGDSSWILAEIERRTRRYEAMFAATDRVPAYALVDRGRYESMFDVMERDPVYEADVLDAIAASRSWLGDETLFPAS